MPIAGWPGRTGYVRSVSEAQTPWPGRLIGVEEEFLVVDPGSRHVVPQAVTVRALDTGGMPGPGSGAGGSTTPGDGRPDSQGERYGIEKELTEYQLEVATPPCATLAELRERLEAARALLRRGRADRPRDAGR